MIPHKTPHRPVPIHRRSSLYQIDFYSTKMTTLNLENLPSEDDRNFIRFESRRSVVHSTKGIISSTQPLANEAGYKILAKGGNAADAAVAVAAALNVTGIFLTGTY